MYSYFANANVELQLCISIPLTYLCVTSAHSETKVQGSPRICLLSLARKVQTQLAFAVFLLKVCAIFSSQVDANLLDPSLIMRELRTFADAALGVDELQVRYTLVLFGSP